MTNYTSNEQYEKDKAALIRIAEGTSMGSLIQNADVIAEFLKQSKWIGSGDDDDTSVLPIPVKKDSNGKLVKDYSYDDWTRKITEEFREILEEVLVEDNTRIAEELQDLITVCTSYLDFLGFDQKKRIELTKHINEKNRMRGYFEED